MHPDRAAVEIGLANGIALRVLAKRYGLDPSQLSRYRSKMDEALIIRLRTRGARSDEELAKIRDVESKSLLDNFTFARSRLYANADKCVGIDDSLGERQALAEAARISERIGKLLGDMGVHTVTNNVQINITAHPDYHRVRTALLRGLRDHPDARLSVFAELEALESVPRPALEHQVAA